MKISVVQQPPIYLNLEKSMARAVELVEDSAAKGCGMVVFPEAWLPGYPTFVWRLPPGAGMGKTDELYALSQANSVDLSRQGLAPLQEAAKEGGVVVVIGNSGDTILNWCRLRMVVCCAKPPSGF